MKRSPAPSPQDSEFADATFDVGGERLTLHNIAVIAQRGGTLYTLTVLCREADWPKRERTLREVARSFRLTS